MLLDVLLASGMSLPLVGVAVPDMEALRVELKKSEHLLREVKQCVQEEHDVVRVVGLGK